MPSPLTNSIFYDLLLNQKQAQTSLQYALLGGSEGSSFAQEQIFEELPIVVFDFETTGLNVKTARAIEIGAIKYQNRKEVARFSELVHPGCKLPPETEKISGITEEMLIGKPTIEKVLPRFHDFIRGCIGVAHNAEYDLGILTYESLRLGVQCSYYLVCTLKMSRALLKLPKNNLDALAQHFQLDFISRHRSIGDILVTAEILWRILDAHQHLRFIRDFKAFEQPPLEV